MARALHPTRERTRKRFVNRALREVIHTRHTANALQVIRLVDRVARRHTALEVAESFRRGLARRMRGPRLQLYLGVSRVLRDPRDARAVARVRAAASQMGRDPAAQLAASRVVAAHGAADESWRWKEKDLIRTWRDDKPWKRTAVEYLEKAERAERLRPDRLVQEGIKSARHDYSRHNWAGGR